MTTTNIVDAARVELLLNELRLPGIRLMWAKLAELSDKEGWPAARFLAALAEHEIADRGRRRIERHLAEARLPAGKTLAAFDFDSVPMVSKAQVMPLAGIARLVQTCTSLEMNVESSRRREALDRKRGRGRPPAHPSIKKTENDED